MDVWNDFFLLYYRSQEIFVSGCVNYLRAMIKLSTMLLQTKFVPYLILVTRRDWQHQRLLQPYSHGEILGYDKLYILDNSNKFKSFISVKLFLVNVQIFVYNCFLKKEKTTLTKPFSCKDCGLHLKMKTQVTWKWRLNFLKMKYVCRNKWKVINKNCN